MNDTPHRRNTVNRTVRALTPLLAAALAVSLSGCFSAFVGDVDPDDSSGTTENVSGVDSSDASNDDTDAAASPQSPTEQAASCEWDEPRLHGDTTLPIGTQGDLADVLTGSWQHTHFDSGSGLEANTNDIRYVFPSEGGLLYCQHVPGVTEHASNSTTFTLDGTLIAPPSPHKGFEVTAWSHDRMQWINHLDGSVYLLSRR